MSYSRDTKYLHPFIAKQLPAILSAIQAKLPAGHSAKVISVHRTPADQFELFKKGRTFRNGSWVKTGAVVTTLDGFVKQSRHNNMPATAMDIGLFNGATYLTNSPLYKHIKEGKKFGLEWGGDWASFVDQPHLEIPTSKLFKGNIIKDSGYVWQQYLTKAGTYKGALDGIFGAGSLKALKEATGETDRTLKAWDKLYAKYGII